MKIWIAATLFFLALPAAAGSIYKCKKAEGGFLYQEKPCAAETESISSWQSRASSDVETNAGESASGNSTFVIGQGRNGHYFVDGTVNDHFLNFVIDTGASLVSIPLELSTAAGIQCQRKAFMQTANGVSSVCYVVIKKLTFGNFTLSNVEAVAAPNLGQPLLGMNVLKRFNVEQKNGQMTFSKQY